MVTRLVNILEGLADDKAAQAANPMMATVMSMMLGWVASTSDSEIEQSVNMVYGMLKVVVEDDSSVAA
jgi:hypothetical protein